MTHLVITGASGGIQQGAAAPNRIEINDFVKSKKSFSLFIQALNAMSQTPQNDSTSHFSIAGIHGLPYTPWQGAGGPHAVEGSQWGGYCTHGSVLFPCWHRPYVCLYEQVMQHYALAIANTYEVDKELWVNTAQNLRLPYWDWATNCVPPREVISQETVNIVTPDGQTTSVENPLFKYTFNPVDTSFPPPYSYWPTTIRHPDDADSANATTDVQGLIDDLSSIQDDITTSTYNLLTRVTAWPGFSNHTPGDGGNTSNSLEAIHDEIHGYIAGHMGDPAVAAFDHLFFLHHANVDRMVCLWTALNPSMWVSTGPAEGGTYTISGNASVGSSTSLTPFWRSQTDFWVSSEITTTQTFQYSYPEFNNLSSDPAAIRDAIGNYINQQYGRSFVAPAPVARSFSTTAPVAPGSTTTPVTSDSSTTAPVTSGSYETVPVTSGPSATAPVVPSSSATAPVAPDSTTAPVTSGTSATAPVTSGTSTTAPVTSGSSGIAPVAPGSATAPVTSGPSATAPVAPGSTTAPVTSGSSGTAPVRSGPSATAPVTPNSSKTAPVTSDPSATAPVTPGSSTAPVSSSSSGTAPVTSGPSATAPVTPSSSTTTPVTSDPSATAPVVPGSSTAPVSSGSSGTAPVTSGPSATAPVAPGSTTASATSGSSGTAPVTSSPSATAPVAPGSTTAPVAPGSTTAPVTSGSSGTAPVAPGSATTPVTSGPSATAPVTPNSSTTAPVTSGPSATAPVTPGSSTTAPVTSDPSATAPVAPGSSTAPVSSGSSGTAPVTSGPSATAPVAPGSTTAPVTSGTSTTAPVTSGSSATAPVAPAPASTAAGYIYPYASRSDGTYTAAKADPRQGATEVRQDWTIRIRFKKFELGQSCTVLIFLGKVPRDVSRWRTSPTFVGAHVSFVNSVTDQCANCRDQAEMVAEGFVHVNNAIAKSGCPSFEPDVVIPYLRENLDWRVQATDRTAVELDRFPSLEVTVVAVPLTHAPGAIFPIAGHPQYHHHITHGRPGGSRHQLHAKT